MDLKHKSAKISTQIAEKKKTMKESKEGKKGGKKRKRLHVMKIKKNNKEKNGQETPMEGEEISSSD